MTVQQVDYGVVVGGNGLSVERVEVVHNYNQPCGRCTIVTNNLAGAELGDGIGITMGYVGNTAQRFTGTVDKITSVTEEGLHTIEGRDALRKAVDFLLVTDDPDNPWLRENISAEALVGALLAEAGLTNYLGDASSFTFNQAPFQLTTAWQAIDQVCSILAWHCWAQVSGQVRFANVLPEPSGSPVATLETGDEGELIVISHLKSTDNLRNKVVVFGKEGIAATASAASPYLPGGFYQTAVISSELIDTQEMADQAASYNLNKWNKLTESVTCQALGDPSIDCRDTVEVIESWAGVSGNWFVYSITHRLASSRYVMDLTLAK